MIENSGKENSKLGNFSYTLFLPDFTERSAGAQDLDFCLQTKKSGIRIFIEVKTILCPS